MTRKNNSEMLSIKLRRAGGCQEETREVSQFATAEQSQQNPARSPECGPELCVNSRVAVSAITASSQAPPAPRSLCLLLTCHRTFRTVVTTAPKEQTRLPSAQAPVPALPASPSPTPLYPQPVEVLSEQVVPFSPGPFPPRLRSAPGRGAGLSPPPGPAAGGSSCTPPALVPLWPAWGSGNPFFQKSLWL